jgi:hypothetical protein
MHDLAELLAEAKRRFLRPQFSADRLLVGPQRHASTSRARRKALKCGRRSGKTTSAAVTMLARAAMLGHACLYLTTTRTNAEEIAWSALLELNEKWALGGVANQTKLTLAFPETGGYVSLRGCHTQRELAKVRGKKWHLVIIDEAQSIPDSILRPLVQSDLGPTLLDFGGELWLVGTPPPVKAGFFWECYAGKHAAQYEQHHWTVVDNTELPRRKAGEPIENILREVREDNGWAESDPTYRREYLGEDLPDEGALLYELSALRNVLPRPDGGQWRYVFGVDVGLRDADAIAVLGWQVGVQRVHLVHEEIGTDQDDHDLAERIKKLVSVYNPLTIAIDRGGGGAKTAATLQRRFGLPLTAAEKTDKPNAIRMLNADLRKGRLVAVPGTRWEEDCKLVQRDPKKLMQDQLAELPREKGGFHSDICDAVLYGWRAAMHWAEKPAAAQLSPEELSIERAVAKQVAANSQDWVRRQAKEFGF